MTVCDGGRRTRRWHECLEAIKAPYDAPAPEMQKRFDLGKKAHYQIEARLHKIKHEQAMTFSDPSLDFDIVYHADLWDQENRIVYDIKPAAWLANNMAYCLAQLSGYKHFLGARAMGFVQYQHSEQRLEGPWFTFVPDSLVRDWAHLRAIAMTSDEMLLLKAANGN